MKKTNCKFLICLSLCHTFPRYVTHYVTSFYLTPHVMLHFHVISQVFLITLTLCHMFSRYVTSFHVISQVTTPVMSHVSRYILPYLTCFHVSSEDFTVCRKVHVTYHVMFHLLTLRLMFSRYVSRFHVTLHIISLSLSSYVSLRLMFSRYVLG